MAKYQLDKVQMKVKLGKEIIELEKVVIHTVGDQMMNIEFY
jgi:hypothetical protein